MIRDLKTLYFCCWIIVSTYITTTSAADRRFLFDYVYDCQHCFQCACQLQRCPNWNIFEISGAYTQCAFTLKDLNCFAPYHEDGGWSLWSTWGTCKGLCSGGTRERTRTCTNPAPHNCGKHCEGNNKDVDYDCSPAWCGTTGSPTTQHLDSSTSYLPTGTDKDLSTELSTDSTKTSTIPTSQVSNITPTPPFEIGSCGYYCSLNALITQTRVTDPGADLCPRGTREGGDALPIVCCNSTRSVYWSAGQNVMQNCDSIRMYNPIASFTNDLLLNGTSGIFLGCIENGSGFQMLRQDCDKATHLVRVTEQQNQYPAPNTFYVVV